MQDRDTTTNRVKLYVDIGREEEAIEVLRSLGYQPLCRDLVHQTVKRDSREEADKTQLEAIVNKDDMDKFIKRLTEKKFCAYSREIQVLVSDAYEPPTMSKVLEIVK
ncbi:hypothetical protein HZB90_03680 [archaeon]|nr:hypothetical protein [archaeon]